MDISTQIHNMPKEMKKSLLNYITDVSPEIASYIKIHVNDSDLDPSIYNGSKRILHPLSIYNKYLQNVDIESTILPEESYYQSDFCDIMSKLYKTEPKVKQVLMSIMNTPCYNKDQFMKIWNSAIAFTREYGNHPECMEFNPLFMGLIVPYKLHVLEFNNMLSFSIDTEFKYRGVLSIKLYIFNLILKYIGEESYIPEYVLGHLMYIFIYGMTDRKVDDNTDYIMNPFFSFIRFINIATKTDEHIDIEEIKSDIESLKVKSISIADAAKEIYEYITIDDTVIIKNTDGLRSTTHHGMGTHKIFFDNCVFFTKGNDSEELMNSGITTNISRFDKEWLAKALENNDEVKAKADDITFELQPNDLGHIIGLTCNATPGVVMDESKKELKSIIKYNNDWYLLFKCYNNTTKVYGISLTDDNNDKILVITKDKKFSYKYIPNF